MLYLRILSLFNIRQFNNYHKGSNHCLSLLILVAAACFNFLYSMCFLKTSIFNINFRLLPESSHALNSPTDFHQNHQAISVPD